MRILLVFITILLGSNGLYANFDFNKDCRLAYEKMMQFKFEESKQLLLQEKKLHPQNKIPSYIEAYIEFWIAALNERANDLERYENMAEEVMEAIEDDEEDSPYKDYLLSDMYLHGAYLMAVESSYMTAAYRFNKAYKLALRNAEEYPNFIPNKKLIGLLNVGIGTVPKNYTWVLSIFNFEGNINKGLVELRKLLNIAAHQSEYQYLISESLLLYSFTITNFEVSKSSRQALSDIYQWKSIDAELPQNQFLIFSKASFLKHTKRNDEAIHCMTRWQQKSGVMHFPYLDYMMGECLLNKLDFSSSTWFQKYISEYTGMSYIRSSYQKIAWGHLLQGNSPGYEKNMKTCLTVGGNNRDSDQQATKEAESTSPPNTALLKARLLFDGGYYTKAEGVLKSAQNAMNSNRDKLEYTYRLARIYDEWGKEQLTQYYYKKCILQGEEKPYYFAANSALHLGYYYERKGNIAQAKALYEQCLDMDFDEYHNSITQKAKAALGRLKES